MVTDIITGILRVLLIKMTDNSKAVGHDQSVFFRSFASFLKAPGGWTSEY